MLIGWTEYCHNVSMLSTPDQQRECRLDVLVALASMRGVGIGRLLVLSPRAATCGQRARSNKRFQLTPERFTLRSKALGRN